MNLSHLCSVSEVELNGVLTSSVADWQHRMGLETRQAEGPQPIRVVLLLLACYDAAGGGTVTF
jgi:hypothetical protein